MFEITIDFGRIWLILYESYIMVYDGMVENAMVSAHEYFTFDIPCTYRINDTVSGRYCLDIPIRNKRISEKMAARMFRQICFHIFRSTDTCTSTFYWWFGLGRFTKT